MFFGVIIDEVDNIYVVVPLHCEAFVQLMVNSKLELKLANETLG